MVDIPVGVREWAAWERTNKADTLAENVEQRAIDSVCDLKSSIVRPLSNVTTTSQSAHIANTKVLSIRLLYSKGSKSIGVAAQNA